MRKFWALAMVAAALQVFVPIPATAASYTATWTKSLANLDPSVGPYIRGWVDLIYDRTNGKVALFGGSGGTYMNDIFHYDTAADTWTLIEPQQNVVGLTPPCPRDEHAVEYDDVNHLYWSYGGSGFGCNANGTAAAGSTLITIVDPSLPATTVDFYKYWPFYMIINGQLSGTSVTGYDPTTKTLTLASPMSSSPVGFPYSLKPQGGGGTWYYNPVTRQWGSLDGPYWGYTGSNPQNRLSPAFAYSPLDGAMVMFGGDQFNDTWKLDVRTKSWTPLIPQGLASSPPALTQMVNAMAYDPDNDVFVMFGGRCADQAARCTYYQTMGDTWTFSLRDNTWINMHPAQSPSPRQQFQMAYDLQNKVMVLFGGGDGAGQTFDEIWVYSYVENTWTQVPTPAENPLDRYNGSMIYDAGNSQFVLYGGLSLTTTILPAWRLRLTANATPSNIAPTVSLTSATSDTGFVAPTNIWLTATAADSDGTVTQVEFLQGTTVIGTSTGPSFTYNWASVPAGNYALTARATDNSGATTTSTPVNVTVAATPSLTNVAARTNGGTATASSTYVETGADFSPSGAIDGGYGGWATGGIWVDNTRGVFPDWMQVNFSGSKTINRIDVFSAQDDRITPTTPTSTMTFSLYGLRNFDVQTWDGSIWVTVPGGAITGNNLVWRSISFPPIATDRIRILVKDALLVYSRIAEVEAWTGGSAPTNTPPTVSLTTPANNASFTAPASITLTATAADSDGTVTQVEFLQGTTVIGTSTGPSFTYNWASVPAGNYALTTRATDNSGATTTSTPVNVTVAATPSLTNVAARTNGGTATASSTYVETGADFSPSGAIDGGYGGWATGGIWVDNTRGVFPDWMQVNFSGSKTINRIDVFSAQDDRITPTTPTSTMTFSLYGLRNFDVQTWDGSIWVTVPGGAITGNNLVWRSISFPPIATDRIRILVKDALLVYSRIAEVEAWTGGSAPTNTPPTVSLTTPANNASFTAPASITLTATAADSDGTVTQVEFLQGTTVIGTSTGPSFTYNWASVPAGNYALTARATDNSGATTTSTPVNVTVTAAAAPPAIAITSVTLVGSVNDPTITLVTVNGAAVPIIGGQFQAPVTLPPGISTHTIAATNSGGTTTKTITINAP